MKNHIRFPGQICTLFFVGLLFFACGEASLQKISSEERVAIDSVIKANRTIDSLSMWLERYTNANNMAGMILVRKELGRHYREKSRFNEAIDIHAPNAW